MSVRVLACAGAASASRNSTTRKNRAIQRIMHGHAASRVRRSGVLPREEAALELADALGELVDRAFDLEVRDDLVDRQRGDARRRRSEIGGPAPELLRRRR